MVNDNGMQQLLDMAHALDTRLRLILDVPYSEKYKHDIEQLRIDVEKLENRSASLKRMITLSTLTDMTPDTPGGVIPPSDEWTHEEWRDDEN